jgi:hypothetical protein
MIRKRDSDGGNLINSNYWNSYSEIKTMPWQVIRHLPLATEVEVQLQGSPCGICGGQSVRERVLSVTALVFPRHYHSASAPYTYFMYVPPTLYNLSN